MYGCALVPFFFFCLIPSAVCGVSDCRSYTVPNKLTVPMLMAGFIYAVVTGSVRDSLIGMAFAGGIMLAAALLGGAGGGDFKMAAALGLWFGFRKVLWVLLIASLVGAAWGIWKLKKTGTAGSRMWLFFHGLLCEVRGMRGALHMPEIPDDSEAPPPPDAVPFGACMALAAWVVWSISVCGVL